MNKIKTHEGYLLIDNRVNEGVPDNIVTAGGLPAGAGRGTFEVATYTCNHCNALVVKNPDRTRERAVCRGCNSVICDACAAVRAQTLTCRPMEQVVDETLTAAERGLLLNS